MQVGDDLHRVELLDADVKFFDELLHFEHEVFATQQFNSAQCDQVRVDQRMDESCKPVNHDHGALFVLTNDGHLFVLHLEQSLADEVIDAAQHAFLRDLVVREVLIPE